MKTLAICWAAIVALLTFIIYIGLLILLLWIATDWHNSDCLLKRIISDIVGIGCFVAIVLILYFMFANAACG